MPGRRRGGRALAEAVLRPSGGRQSL